MTRVHYDRLPWLPRGRNASRVQRSNARLQRDWRRAQRMAQSWPQFGAPLWLDMLRQLPPWMLDPHAPGGPRHLSSHYGVDGKRIGIVQASLLLGDEKARRVGLTKIGEYEVSTVFLPDLPPAHDGRRLLYESLVSSTRGGPTQVWRTTTRKRAVLMHAQVCDMVAQGKFDGDRREPDDADRAELAELLGADMVGKLLNENPNRGLEQR